MDSEEFWRVKPALATSHYVSDTVLKGVSIFLSSERSILVKTSKTVPVFLTELGGFTLVAYCVFGLVNYLFNINTLQKYFISKLY